MKKIVLLLVGLLFLVANQSFAKRVPIEKTREQKKEELDRIEALLLTAQVERGTHFFWLTVGSAAFLAGWFSQHHFGPKEYRKFPACCHKALIEAPPKRDSRGYGIPQYNTPFRGYVSFTSWVLKYAGGIVAVPNAILLMLSDLEVRDLQERIIKLRGELSEGVELGWLQR